MNQGRVMRPFFFALSAALCGHGSRARIMLASILITSSAPVSRRLGGITDVPVRRRHRRLPTRALSNRGPDGGRHGGATRTYVDMATAAFYAARFGHAPRWAAQSAHRRARV